MNNIHLILFVALGIAVNIVAALIYVKLARKTATKLFENAPEDGQLFVEYIWKETAGKTYRLHKILNLLLLHFNIFTISYIVSQSGWLIAGSALFTIAYVGFWSLLIYISYLTYVKLHESEVGFFPFLRFMTLFFSTELLMPFGILCGFILMRVSVIVLELPINLWLWTGIVLFSFILTLWVFSYLSAFNLMFYIKNCDVEWINATVKEFAEKLNIKIGQSKLLVIPGGKFINAFAYDNYILISDRMIDVLSQDELRCVLAHEAAHIKLKHFLKRGYLATVILFLAFALVGYKLYAFNQLEQFSLVDMYLLIGVPLVFNLLLKRSYKKMETQADKLAAEIIGSADTYANALEKLYEVAKLPRKMKRAGASHPDLTERIRDVKGDS